MIVIEDTCGKCKSVQFFEEIAHNKWRCVNCGRIKIKHVHKPISDVTSTDQIGIVQLIKEGYYISLPIGDFIIKNEDIQKLNKGTTYLPVYRVGKGSVKLT